MLKFHLCLQGRPEGTRGEAIQIGGLSVMSLAVDAAAAATAWEITFDQVLSELARLPRMLIEPDGSFVWTSSQGETPWQIDGNLFDQGDRLSYVELQGTCPEERLNEFLSAFGWPQMPLLFQLPRLAVYLDEEDFRRVARAGWRVKTQ